MATRSNAALPALRPVPLTRPLRWLLLGWRDFTRAMLPSALQGLVAALGGYAIVAVAWGRFSLLPGAFSGFLLVAPILATGLYALSRRLERGERAGFDAVLDAWRIGRRPLVGLGVLLALAGTLWVALSAGLVSLFVQEPIGGLERFVRLVVLSEGSPLFPVWLACGGMLAAAVFALSVVSAPLLLERDLPLSQALRTSLRAVALNPLPLALWGALIMLATVLAMLTLLLGLVLVVPVLGHASWHAYRDLVDADALPARAAR